MYNVANSTVKMFCSSRQNNQSRRQKNPNLSLDVTICQLLANFDWAEPRTRHIKML